MKAAITRLEPGPEIRSAGATSEISATSSRMRGLVSKGEVSEFRFGAAVGDKTTAMTAIYGRYANRLEAQNAVLGDVQKRFANIDWKTRLGNGPAASGEATAK